MLEHYWRDAVRSNSLRALCLLDLFLCHVCCEVGGGSLDVSKQVAALLGVVDFG